MTKSFNRCCRKPRYFMRKTKLFTFKFKSSSKINLNTKNVFSNLINLQRLKKNLNLKLHINQIALDYYILSSIYHQPNADEEKFQPLLSMLWNSLTQRLINF